MTVGILPAVKLNAIAFDSPVDLSTFVGSFYLEWNTDTSDFIPGFNGHFELEVATDSLFNSLVLNILSFLSTGFEAFIGGSWVPLTTAGLAPTDFGSKVRYLVTGLPINDYFWRVRSMQQV